MKKFFLIGVFLLYIISTGNDYLMPSCNVSTAKQAIAPRIFAEQTIDGPRQPPLVTRFLHNKLGIFASEFGRCYFNALDPNFIYKSVGILGLFFWTYFIYQIAIKKLWPGILVFLTLPLLPFFSLPIIITVYVNKIFAIIGLIILIKQKWEVKSEKQEI